jgi:hypothetical protein
VGNGIAVRQLRTDKCRTVRRIALEIGSVTACTVGCIVGDEGVDEIALAMPQICPAAEDSEKQENDKYLLQFRPLLLSL